MHSLKTGCAYSDILYEKELLRDCMAANKSFKRNTVTKRVLVFFLCLVVSLSLFPMDAFAEDSSRSYLFDLTANGNNEVNVEPGDIITVMLHLKRTDSSEPSLLYTMQDEINYDENCFRLVKNGEMAADNICTTDLARQDGARAYYMNYVSVNGGDMWDADMMIGMFQLEVIGSSGKTAIENKKYLVSTQDGSDAYQSVANDLHVIIKGDLTVSFVTDEGTELDTVIVKYGDLLPRPAEPEKKGYIFSGWYRDTDGTKPWNFETDAVEENMTLDAKWTKNSASPIIWIALAVLLIVIVLLLVLKRSKK